MRRMVFAVLSALVAMLLVVILQGSAPAHASHNWVWTWTRMASNTICIQNHTPSSWRAYYSAVDYDRARDIRVVWKNAYGQPYPYGRCRGFDAVIMILRKPDLGGAVGITQNLENPNLRYVYLDEGKFPEYSPGNRQHIISHEIGHAVGFGHNSSWSIMYGSWPAPQWLQPIDYQAINTRY